MIGEPPWRLNSTFRGNRQAERRIEGIEIVFPIRREVHLFELKDRIVLAIGVEILEPVADHKSPGFKRVQRKVVCVGNDDAVGVAKRPIELLFAHLIFGESQH